MVALMRTPDNAVRGQIQVILDGHILFPDTSKVQGYLQYTTNSIFPLPMGSGVSIQMISTTWWTTVKSIHQKNFPLVTAKISQK